MTIHNQLLTKKEGDVTIYEWPLTIKRQQQQQQLSVGLERSHCSQYCYYYYYSHYYYHSIITTTLTTTTASITTTVTGTIKKTITYDFHCHNGENPTTVREPNYEKEQDAIQGCMLPCTRSYKVRSCGNNRGVPNHPSSKLHHYYSFRHRATTTGIFQNNLNSSNLYNHIILSIDQNIKNI